MDYQMLVLDLDGTLTNSRKELTEPTKQALIEIQEEGKKEVDGITWEKVGLRIRALYEDVLRNYGK